MRDSNSSAITNHDLKVASTLRRYYYQKKGVLHLTQESIAEDLHVTQPTVSMDLNGQKHISLERLIEYAEILHISPHQLDPRLSR